MSAVFADNSPNSDIGSGYIGDVAGELQNTQSFVTYLMWNPNLPGSIDLPLGSVAWQWACDVVNTLIPQNNGTNWLRVCAAPSTPGSVQVTAGSLYPKWQYVALNGQTCSSS